jgi:hypothetical protein
MRLFVSRAVRARGACCRPAGLVAVLCLLAGCAALADNVDALGPTVAEISAMPLDAAQATLADRTVCHSMPELPVATRSANTRPARLITATVRRSNILHRTGIIFSGIRAIHVRSMASV